MARITGTYLETGTADESVRCFIPKALPPQMPALTLDDDQLALLRQAEDAIKRLSLAAHMLPSAQWFVYGFVRKEAVISSQIEGTQATLQDLVHFEATDISADPSDVEDVCNYVAAYQFAYQQMHSKSGLPISRRLLCETHQHLMAGVRGAHKLPGQVRKSQNWIGGSRPGNARFVPAPPDHIDSLLSDLEHWIHGDDPLPPLIRAGLAHVQFETIHPFLDGNGRLGRMLISLLLDHWNIIDGQILYLSLAFKRRQSTYYTLLDTVRADGNWEAWCTFFLSCVIEAAEDGIQSATNIFRLFNQDRSRLIHNAAATVNAIRLFELLPEHPIINTARVVDLLSTTKPTAQKAIDALVSAHILSETSGKSRDRLYSYTSYLSELSRD